ncbi:MAG: hypothetical protein WC521_08460 [Bdellovibrionales bacterium]
METDNTYYVVIDNFYDLFDYTNGLRAEPLRGIPDDEIGHLYDHDATLGGRKPEKNDDTSFRPGQYLNIKRTAEKSCFFGIITSRDFPVIGEYYHRHYAEKAGLLPDTVFAGTSGGYRYKVNLASDAEPEVIPVRDENGNPYDAKLIRSAVVGMHIITDALEKRVPSIVKSDRRVLGSTALCSEFPDDEMLQNFRQYAKDLTDKLQECLSHRIKLVIDSKFNEKRTGYSDLKILYATKYQAVIEILQLRKQKGLKQPKFVFAAGDTSPDLMIIKAAKDFFGNEKVLGVGVGSVIQREDTDHLLNVVLKGNSPIVSDMQKGFFTDVDMMHVFLAYLRAPEKTRAYIKNIEDSLGANRSEKSIFAAKRASPAAAKYE